MIVDVSVPKLLMINRQSHHVPVVDVVSIVPDWSLLVPKDNNTATSRLFAPLPRDIQIEQEYFEDSVLNGFALLGGVWTFVNGLFAAIFGSTLLLVLFGLFLFPTFRHSFIIKR